MSQNGHGRYVYLNCEDLPKFFLVYLTDPSDSGRIHSNVYERWTKGDSEVKDGMQKFASLAEQAVQVNRVLSSKKNGEIFIFILPIREVI